MSHAVEIRDLFRVYPLPREALSRSGAHARRAGGRGVRSARASGSGKTTSYGCWPASTGRPPARSRFSDSTWRSSRGETSAAIAQRLGYADQHYRRALAAELEARELVGLQLALAGVPLERLARADGLLERVGLLDRRSAHPDELSGGEQQRIAVCAAVAHRPRLLLADEPTGELDAGNAHVVYELLGELAREAGATTIIVSHDPESAVIADRIVHVRDGRVSEGGARGGRTKPSWSGAAAGCGCPRSSSAGPGFARAPEPGCTRTAS